MVCSIKKISTSGVYKITSPNGRIYIGSSVNIEERFRTYGRFHCKRQIRLYNSLVKYGPENHIFEILEKCGPMDTFPLERAWGLFYNSLDQKLGLNSSLPGYGEIKKLLSKESCHKISISKKGKTVCEEGKLKLQKFNESKKYSVEKKLEIYQKKKEKYRITNMFPDKTGRSSNLILNVETGVFYKSEPEANKSLSNPYPRSSFRSKGIIF